MLLGTLTMVYVLYGLGNSYSFKQEFILNKTLFVVIALLYPLLDLLRVFVLRILDGKSPFLADQKHIHHFLLKKTSSSIAVVFIILLIQLIFTLFFIMRTLNLLLLFIKPIPTQSRPVRSSPLHSVPPHSFRTDGNGTEWSGVDWSGLEWSGVGWAGFYPPNSTVDF